MLLLPVVAIWLWLLHNGTCPFYYPQARYRLRTIAAFSLWYSFLLQIFWCVIIVMLWDLYLFCLFTVKIPITLSFRLFRVFVQVLCSFSTLPLYAIVTQVRFSHNLSSELQFKLAKLTVISPILSLFLPFFPFFFCGNEMKMGSSFRKAIFDYHVLKGLVGWTEKA